MDLLQFVVERYNYWIFIVLMMTGLYTVIARGNLIKKIIGLNIFQTSVFIYYISIGKISGGTAPIYVPGDMERRAGHHGDGHGDGHAGAHAETHGSGAAESTGVDYGADYGVDHGAAAHSADALHAGAANQAPAHGAGVEDTSADDTSADDTSAGDKGAEKGAVHDGAANAPLAVPDSAGPDSASADAAPYDLSTGADPAQGVDFDGGYEGGYEGGAAAAEVLYSNPLPHVLILTAIVVGVATTAVGLALAVRIREAYGTIEEDELETADNIAEFGKADPRNGGQTAAGGA